MSSKALAEVIHTCADCVQQLGIKIQSQGPAQMPESNPPQNTTSKPYPPKLLIREHGIGIFYVFKGLSRGYSYICRLRTAAVYLDLEYIPSPAPLVGFHDSWATCEQQNQKYAYDPTDSIDWLLSTTAGPILPGKGIQTKAKAKATFCSKSRTSPM